MSAIATAWAWKQKLSYTDKLILLGYALVADDTNQSSPPREMLMELTGFGETTIRRATADLQKAGLLLACADVIRPDARGASKLVPRFKLQCPSILGQ